MSFRLPDYQTFMDNVSILSLPISGSELHGLMCGYLCAGATDRGEAYLRALMTNKINEAKRSAVLALFDVYAISQQQINDLDFSFQLLIPPEEESLKVRAQAFGEWCNGFVQGLTMAGIDYDLLAETDSQDAMLHLTEFASLDYEALQIDEQDERALMEVSEYARLAVLRIYSDLQDNALQDDTPEKPH